LSENVECHLNVFFAKNIEALFFILLRQQKN